MNYRGRIAPTPTGYLHLGHARTFWTALIRAQQRDGVIVLRNDDLDSARCKPEFVDAMIDDLRWFGFEWQEGPDIGGPFGPYNQSERMDLYRDALRRLQSIDAIYPCACSRKDIAAAVNAPHSADDEIIYPGTCRPDAGAARTLVESMRKNFRFRVPDGEAVEFDDLNFGPQKFVAGKDFGDFVVWRSDDVPAYQLACVVDDSAMRITEVVRGADLLVSTARQLLLYRALNLTPPQFYHCPLMTDSSGTRLAKRHDSLSLRSLRASARTPEDLRAEF